ncbi:MAG: enoyl-[acyl-carrier-protein] reductase FabI [Hirschia sp.]|nr:enoyl-[acyl-carrier-protein] reductase FabI [Hirschia sp.]MBF18616.1 enoyl-[acyl-carrier-protein] reductase FabI [Hirschia sp.]|tara:strand:+ start:987 stop:1802 length:816 start_codon:yes stop_codon:yes gene_type:complete
MAEWTFPKGDLMAGKRGLVMGVANQNSIAWGISQQLAAQGAEMAFTYQGEALERRVRPLIESIGMDTMISADVTNDEEMDAAFATLKEKWGKIDFLVHAIAFAGKDELQGSMVANTTREGFRRAMDISVFSFIDACRRASEMMPDGGSIINMTYLGSERVIPSYNVMGVAKAGLEASTRYAARDLGTQGIRVNAISAGPMRTLALMGIKGSKSLMSTGREWSLLKEDTTMEGVAGAALYLLSPIGQSITGEVLHVDAGFHVVGVPEPSEEG